MQISANGKLMPCISHQMLKAMKLLMIFLLVASFYAQANISAQTVTLKANKLAFTKVLREVKKQTGYDYVVNDRFIQLAKPVTLNAEKISLDLFLVECFREQPFSYQVQNKTIIVKEKEKIMPVVPNGDAGVMVPANIDVTVTVVAAENNQALEGASVTIKGNNKGVATGVNGRAVLKDVDANATLVISYTGYKNEEVKLNGRNSVVVKLVASTSELQEVVINKGYYTEKQKLSVSNVGRVTAKEIETQPVTNVLLALQARVPGLFIQQNTGLSGGGISVRIQGQNSLRNGSDPLYIIDGVPYLSQLPTTGGVDAVLGHGSSGGRLNGGLYGTGNPLNYINPSDIENIEVLKDADATAIYGSRAANGAILITTKKGKIGRTSLDMNVQQGLGQVTRKLNMLNTSQYLQMRHEAINNDGLTVSPFDYDLNGTWDTTRNTDWQKELIGGTSQYSNINLNISGGNTAAQYIVGATWHRETTVFPGDFDDKKVAVHFIINSASANQKFRMQFSGNYLVDNNKLPTNDLTQKAILLEPVAPKVYNQDGSLNWALDGSGASTFDNPLQYLYNIYKNKTSNLIGNAVLSYMILPGLDIRSSFGYNNLQTNDIQATPLSAINPYNIIVNGYERTSLIGYRNINSSIIEPQINYKKEIAKGTLDVLIGGTYQRNNINLNSIAATGFSNDRVIEDISSATTISPNASLVSVYKYNALFGRINYNWQNKYLLNLNARRDGSSRFGDENQFHNFGSIGAGWIFTEEKFVQKNAKFISFGKLRGSYGTTGSDQIGDYTFLNLYNVVTSGVPYQGLTGLRPNSLRNPFLAWEETRKLQIGLDLGILNDRILLNTTYARNRSSNQLLNYTLPTITGFTGVYENFPATIQNTSWEFSLNTINITKKNLNWQTSINLTIPRNKIVSFPNIASTPYASSSNGVVVGQPVGIIPSYVFIGVDPATGQHQYRDVHGDATFTPNSLTDKAAFISTLPKLYGGFHNNLSYKNFQLDIMFQFVKQKGLSTFFYNNFLHPGMFYQGSSNQPATVLNRWQKPGDIADIHKFTTIGTNELYNVVASDYSYGDASYIRLKNLSVSWELPASLKKKAHLQNCKLYVEGQNLLTITSYKGLDPENQSISSLPPLRIWTMGIRIGF